MMSASSIKNVLGNKEPGFKVFIATVFLFHVPEDITSHQILYRVHFSPLIHAFGNIIYLYFSLKII